MICMLIKPSRVSVPISTLKTNDHCRPTLDLGLVASIKEGGLQCPVVVRQNGTVHDGNRRVAACRSLGMETIMADVFPDAGLIIDL